jgi:uncharacterized protein YjcR
MLRPGLTAAEIAEQYDRSLSTVRNVWARHEAWPAPCGKRGRALEYDPAAVAQFVREHIDRPVELDPDRLYTVQEIAAATDLRPGTIRADRSRGRWVEPDEERDGTALWYGRTVLELLASRPGRGRAAGS